MAEELESPGNPDAVNEPVNPKVNDAPKSPAIVKRTALKPPKEAPTEKQIRALQESQSRLEDRMDGVEGALKETNDFIEKAFSGRGHGPRSGGGAESSALDDLADDIFRTD